MGMELESPADAWYVWLGVSIVSVAMAGVAVGLPAAAPPDATEAANAIDEVAGSPYNASVEPTEHDADTYWLDSRRIALRNEGGTRHASVTFVEMTPVWPDERLQEVLYGTPIGEAFDSRAEFLDAARDARREARRAVSDGDTEWVKATGYLRVRTVTWPGGDNVTLVEF